MSLDDLQHSWNDLARKDAMWAVLTGPVGAGRAWDAEAFFRTGVEEIAFILQRVRAAGAVPRRGRALDFGCGLGRLTQALGAEFERADGVDIAEAMIEQARALNRRADRCHYHLNTAADLRLFADATFDFVYSSITLQHIEPEFSRRYIEEFFRVARPGGIVVFQLPSHPVADTKPHTWNPAILPRDGCRARIEAPSAIECTAGERVIVPAVVQNTSARPWPARGNPDNTFSIRLGNHWRSWLGRMLVFDDRRAQLPQDVAPGERVEIGLEVNAPERPGRYVLELDMVQENVHWFATQGSPTTRVRVRVKRPASAPGAGGGMPPRMQMHGIPRGETEALIAASGGTLLAVEENDAAGPGWVSYRYIAAIAASPSASS